MGLITQLVLEGTLDEARDVTRFFARVGLPTHLEQLSLSPDDRAAMKVVADVALSLPIIANEPFPVTNESLVEALIAADTLGREVAGTMGDAAYRALHQPS